MPRRKPASARQNRETRDIGLVRQATVGTPDPPEMPNGGELPVEVLHAWAEFWRSDVSGLVVAADRPMLDRLFVNYAIHQTMMATWMAEPFTLGSTGQVTLHPAGKIAADLEARILPLEDRFGISPSARLKLGIVLGAAAKSLEDMNRAFKGGSEDDEDDDEFDPRQAVIEVVDTTPKPRPRAKRAEVAPVSRRPRREVDAADADPRGG